jgi:superfamily II DNA or RNA helicase
VLGFFTKLSDGNESFIESLEILSLIPTMRESKSKFELSKWQSDFVEDFLQQPSRKSLLVASPGTGKTVAALSAARQMLEGRV